jgi:uncharacterized membrane protein YeaQ/YmgE (transglycosylase-associated protein family)
LGGVWRAGRLDRQHHHGQEQKMGALANIVTGIIGAFLGGAIMNTFGYQGFTGFNIWSLLVAIGGAVVLIWVVGLISETAISSLRASPTKQK